MQFSIHAWAEPSTVCRLIDPIARQGITAKSITANLDGDEICITISLGEVSRRDAEMIKGQIERLVIVRNIVMLEEQPSELVLDGDARELVA